MRLLAADVSGRDQVEGMQCRTIDADGSLELIVRDDAPPASVEGRVPAEGHMLDSDGMMIHLLLHVVDGRLTELEIYRDDSTPPRVSVDPASVEAGYADAETTTPPVDPGERH